MESMDPTKKTREQEIEEMLRRQAEEDAESQRRMEEAERMMQEVLARADALETDSDEPAPSIPPPSRPGKKKSKETSPKTPAEEISGFISEFDLEPLLPPLFGELNEAQQLKVARDLKRRIVDVVKSDGQIRYSEYLKKEMARCVNPKDNIILRSLDTVSESIDKSISKESDLKEIEGKIFRELRDTEEGKKFIAEDLMRLTEMVKNKEVIIFKSGNPHIKYLDINNIQNPTEEEMTAYNNFNGKADRFTQMPYEWGQEKSGKNKKAYDKAKKEYEDATVEIAKIKMARGEGGDDVVTKMLEIRNVLQMEQLLNTHPEFEKALDDFSRSAGGKEMAKTAGKFLNTLTGKNRWNRGLTAGGFVARMGAKGAALATGISGLTFIGGAAVGGVVGYWRGKIRARGTLEERQKQARHGKKDTNKEKGKIVDVITLNNGLNKIITEIENTAEGSVRIGGSKHLKSEGMQISRKVELLAKLATIIGYAQDQIEKGQVNFGDAKIALANQFNFVNNLNRAIVLREMNTETTHKEVTEWINGLIATQGEKVAGKISETQEKFIKTQAWRGAAMGAGFATLGYGVRLFGEHMGWWGGHTPTGKPPIQQPTGTRPGEIAGVSPKESARLANMFAKSGFRETNENGQTVWIENNNDGSLFRKIFPNGRDEIWRNGKIEKVQQFSQQNAEAWNKQFGFKMEVHDTPATPPIAPPEPVKPPVADVITPKIETQKFIVDIDRQLNTNKDYQDFITDERIKIRALEAEELLKLQHGQLTQEEFDINKRLHEIEIDEKIILKRKELILEKIKEALTPKKGAKLEPLPLIPKEASSPFSAYAAEQNSPSGADAAKNALAQTNKDLSDKAAEKAKLLEKLRALKASRPETPRTAPEVIEGKAPTPPETPSAPAPETVATPPTVAPTAPAPEETPTGFSLKLGTEGNPKNLEKFFFGMINKTDLPEGGKIAGEEQIAAATKSLNVAANLVKLTEGHNVAGISAEDFAKTFEIRNGTLRVTDSRGFNGIVEQLKTHAEENWGKGILQSKGAAQSYVGNIKDDFRINLPGGHGAGVNDAEISVPATEPNSEINYTPARNYTPIGETHTLEPEPATSAPTPEPAPISKPAAAVEEARRVVMEKMETTTKPEIPIVPSQSENGSNLVQILRTHPEFAKNPFHLTGEKLMQAYEVGQKNIAHILNENNNHITNDEWLKIKDLKATKIFGKDVDSAHPVVEYLHKLYNVTKLKPHGGIFRHNETINEYIARALQRATLLGKLNQVELE